MNPNFLRRMSSGCPYKSHLGILGIKAAKDGETAFQAFGNALDQAIGETSVKIFGDNSPNLPRQGLLRYPTVVLLFCSGASGASHGNIVLGGMVDTYHDYPSACWNVTAEGAMRQRWRDEALTWFPTIQSAFLFGHSYGGVCVEAFGNWLWPLIGTGEVVCETYGSPRTCIPSRMSGGSNWFRRRNVHSLDVVSHIPYHTAEAAYASAMTTTRARTAFDMSGHSCMASVYLFSGQNSEMPNNPVTAQDSSLSMLAWVSYLNHITSRDHELDTYVATMTAAALASPFGQLPPASVTTVPAIALPTYVPSGPDVVIGEPLTPEQLYIEILAQEEAAAAEFFHSPIRRPAVGVRLHGAAGVRFMDMVRVHASGLRSAKGLAKRLNRIRRLLGPITTEQRAEIIAAITADFTGE